MEFPTEVRKMGEYCRHCGQKRIVDAPPFAEMSQEDIADWKASGGEIVLLECFNGCGD